MTRNQSQSSSLWKGIVIYRILSLVLPLIDLVPKDSLRSRDPGAGAG